jgi:hypothetical protein
LREQAHSALDELFKVKEKIEAIPEGGDHAVIASHIRSVKRKLEQVNSRLRAIRSTVRPAQEFLAARNLQGIAEWAAHDNCAHALAGQINFVGKELVIETTAGICSLSAPTGLATFVVPDFDDLVRLIALT